MQQFEPIVPMQDITTSITVGLMVVISLLKKKTMIIFCDYTINTLQQWQIRLPGV